MSLGLQGSLGGSQGMQQAPEVALGKAEQLLQPLQQHQRGHCKTSVRQRGMSQGLQRSMGRPQGKSQALKAAMRGGQLLEACNSRQSSKRWPLPSWW